ncbi:MULTISPECIES: acyltransferase family protein [Marinobacter]|uniref:acyltransferase family protein n=1 Tax=Marinobacter TaxID=2742 RepID=UPI00124611DD|nr:MULTISPECIES: acyltransferase family protein [Marinobacter]MBL3556720.1 acyltransferase [Marinobacter sp. JB05H06]
MTAIRTDTRRRNDIQGLRAVGALLVAIYHIWIGRVSGGVDVFFIVSGFLLIGSLSRELESSQHVDLLSFLNRLARRLLPAAFFVIIAILATGWLWLPKIQWDRTIEHLAASTLYIENWLLAFNSVDYLARETTGSPVQHYWAMSAQVQSLALVAILLTTLGWVMRLTGKTVTQHRLLSFLSFLFFTSFIYSVVTTANNQAFAYFDTFARVWEFIAGGLVALLLPKFTLGNYSRLVLGWLGLIAIILCGIIIDVSTLFPGYVALWPMSAATMILAAGYGPSVSFGVEHILGSKPLVWLGNISYSFYLWHWPILVGYLTLSYKNSVSLEAGFSILLVSIGLAYLSERYIERPFQATQKINQFRTVFGSILSVGLISLVLLTWNTYKNHLIDQEFALAYASNTYTGSAALNTVEYDSGDSPIYPGLLTASQDRGLLYRRGCIQTMSGTEIKSCTFGPENAKFEMALVGGSHSAQWVPAFLILLKKIPDWKLTVYTKSVCPFSTEPLTNIKEYRDSCREWNASLLRRLIESPPDVVITLATRTTYPQSTEREHVPQGYRNQWLALLQKGINVIALRDTPRFGFDVPLCVDVNGRNSIDCMIEREKLLQNSNPAMVLEEAEELNIVDLSNSFCTKKTCPPVVGNLLVYRDKGHLSAAYMKSVASRLGEEFIPRLMQIRDLNRLGSTPLN